jgi:beta-glucanase (GH16 family)
LFNDYIINLLIGLLLCITTLCKAADNTTHVTGWNLIWQDEFDYPLTSLEKYWNFEIGYGNNGWGNNEWQEYTTENVEIIEGSLVITARSSMKPGKRDGSITSSRLTTLGKFQFEPGVRILSRIKLPWGQGIWPAFWALGSNHSSIGWPTCGEIDILEMIGGNPISNANNFTIHSTAHWNDNFDSHNYKHAQYGKHKVIENSLSDEYHIFELIYANDHLETKIDGDSIFKMDTKAGKVVKPFHNPFYLILNLAVGGNWPGSPTPETIFPQKMYIDYIRVYQR